MQENNLNSMLKMAQDAMKNSYSPYSRYRVGACIKTNNDQFFVGTNVENASYPLCVCAETVAITTMISAGEHKIKEMVVTHQNESEQICAPCGACRQRIFEFATPETRIHLANAVGIQKTFTIAELLPETFVFEPPQAS